MTRNYHDPKLVAIPPRWRGRAGGPKWHNGALHEDIEAIPRRKSCLRPRVNVRHPDHSKYDLAALRIAQNPLWGSPMVGKVWNEYEPLSPLLGLCAMATGPVA
jgi:hypothetical protein